MNEVLLLPHLNDATYVVWSVVIAVGIGNDSHSTKVIHVAEHISPLHSVSRVPNCEAIAEQIFGGSRNTKLNMQLPVLSTYGL